MGLFGGKKNHQCSECDERFAKRNELIHHASIVHNRTILKCHHCNKSYLNNDNLIEHIKRHKVSLPWRMALSWTNLAFIDINKFWLAVLIRFVTTMGVLLLFVYALNFFDFPESTGAIFIVYWIVEPQMIYFMWRWAKKWNNRLDVMIQEISQNNEKAN